MKNLLILGTGTYGTMMANHLSSKWDKDRWYINHWRLLQQGRSRWHSNVVYIVGN